MIINRNNKKAELLQVLLFFDLAIYCHDLVKIKV